MGICTGWWETLQPNRLKTVYGMRVFNTLLPPKDRQSSNPLTASRPMATISVVRNTCLLAQWSTVLAIWILSPKDSADDRNWDDNCLSVISIKFFWAWVIFFFLNNWIAWKMYWYTVNSQGTAWVHNQTSVLQLCKGPFPSACSTFCTVAVPDSYCHWHPTPQIQQPEQVAATAWPSLDWELQLLKVKALGH